MTSTRLALAPLITAGLLFFGVSQASAAPVHAKNASFTTVLCSDGNMYDVVTNGGGNSDNSKAVTPAHILSVNGVPTDMTFATKSLTVTGTEGGQVVFGPSTISHAQNASFQSSSSLLTCTGSFMFTDPSNGMPVTVSIVATGFIA